MRHFNSQFFSGNGHLSTQREILAYNIFENAIQTLCGSDQLGSSPETDSILELAVHDIAAFLTGKEIAFTNIPSKKVIDIELSQKERFPRLKAGETVKIVFPREVGKQNEELYYWNGAVGKINYVILDTDSSCLQGTVGVKFSLETLLELENSIRASKGFKPKTTPFTEEGNWQTQRQSPFLFQNQSMCMKDGTVLFLPEFVEKCSENVKINPESVPKVSLEDLVNELY